MIVIDSSISNDTLDYLPIYSIMNKKAQKSLS